MLALSAVNEALALRRSLHTSLLRRHLCALVELPLALLLPSFLLVPLCSCCRCRAAWLNQAVLGAFLDKAGGNEVIRRTSHIEGSKPTSWACGSPARPLTAAASRGSVSGGGEGGRIWGGWVGGWACGLMRGKVFCCISANFEPPRGPPKPYPKIYQLAWTACLRAFSTAAGPHSASRLSVSL